LCMTMLLYCISSSRLNAQTDMDAITLKKNVLCVGGMYVNDRWDEYWEGTFKRNNRNIGTVTTQMFALAGAYGVTDKLNVMFMAPYVKTKASRGTLTGLDGIQDLSLMAKYKAAEKKFGNGSRLSVFAIGRVSFPLTDYVADFLPVSIGLRSKTAGIRGMVDYQFKKFFVTASGAYTLRSNIEIDRESYYTTEMKNTNEVEMPNTTDYSVRAGFRSRYLIAEAVFTDMYTLGGFDIRKNDMPFPSNEMNARRIGAAFKYTFKKVRGLEVVGGAMYTLHGRNVGQSTTFNGGVFYLMNLSSKNSPRTDQQQN
jgi:hypothetical protein